MSPSKPSKSSKRSKPAKTSKRSKPAKTDPVLCERMGSVMRVTLNRPDARNALDGPTVEALHGILDGLSDDRTVRAIVLSGAGEMFCAGGDIKGFRETFQSGAPDLQSVTRINRDNRRFGDLLIKLDRAPQTVVCVVHGAAMGGGIGLVAVSDIAIAEADARFSMTETSIGLPPAQIAAFVVRRIGLTQARRLMLTAARFDGEEARRLGLVHLTAPTRDDLAAIEAEILDGIDRCSPMANAATKEILHAALDGRLEETLDFAARKFAQCMLGEEGLEGVSSFLERRKPAWRERDGDE